MRTPLPVRWFSWLYLGSLAVSLIAMTATWDDLVKDLPDGELGDMATYAVMAVSALSFVISLLLWWYIMRRRSGTARTILTVLSVIGAVLVGFAVAEPYLGDVVDPDTRALGWRIAENAAVVVGLVANALLFTPGARYWFTRDPEFSDVFS